MAITNKNLICRSLERKMLACIEEYEDKDDLKEELLDFGVYYNEHRSHSALGYRLTPKEFIQNSKCVN